MGAADSVRLDVTDGVATVTLAEPDVRNAFTRAVAAGVSDAFDRIEDRDDVRCVVVAGAGDAFSAGGDVQKMRERLDGDVAPHESVAELRRSTSAAIARVATTPVPTIAKVDGPAVGAGANLAIACDVQLASEDASIGFVFRQVGLSVDAGTSYLLPRVVGTNVAKELVFTGEVLDAERASSLGLFNRVYAADEFEAEVAAFTERVASGPTVALRHAKRLLDEGFEKPLERAVTDEATAQGVVFETDDHREGVAAFFEGRDPEFEGR
ncbi:enoyl-CoA hydratase/isomerase family protein [Halobacterium yunchengense]|uniref:enoyl-CoA hydratase/isomerase family protein n=1 Tax=Halobacterium yunchengense TaxID=3108497 RepID=UPI00300AD181